MDESEEEATVVVNGMSENHPDSFALFISCRFFFRPSSASPDSPYPGTMGVIDWRNRNSKSRRGRWVRLEEG